MKVFFLHGRYCGQEKEYPDRCFPRFRLPVPQGAGDRVSISVEDYEVHQYVMPGGRTVLFAVLSGTDFETEHKAFQQRAEKYFVSGAGQCKYACRYRQG